MSMITRLVVIDHNFKTCAAKAIFTLAKFTAKTSAIMPSSFFAMATLGDALRNRNDPIGVVSPKVAKASAVTSHCHWHYRQKLPPM